MTRGDRAERRRLVMLATRIHGVHVAQASLDAILPCPATWPSDEPGPDYAGTRCDLIEGHQPDDPLEDGSAHRHRVLGSQVVVRW